MKAAVKHASYLELDRLILGEQVEEETSAHVAACARCASYVARAHERSGETPDWVVALGASGVENHALPVAGARKKVRALRGWAAPLLAAAALFGGAVFVTSSWPDRADFGRAYVATKGGPSVGVYVKRDDRVFLWDGEGPLQVGDHIRLGVAGAEYRHVAVLSAAGDGWVVLYRGELTPEGELPVAWSIDGQGDAEQLLVVLSHQALSDTELAQRAQRDAASAKDTWVRKYVLPKQHRSAP